jgi:prepilin-type N-terminal cleavage/methylation domain-containing protein
MLRPGVTLIEILCSMAVIAVLMGLLVPGLSKANEVARKVVCSSNLRQIGFGISSYADANKDRLPPSAFLPAGWGGRSESADGSPEQMLIVRVWHKKLALNDGILWDGLGRLFFAGHLAPGKVYYCPSHRGNHPFRKYANTWGETTGEIVSNYQYRGRGPQQNGVAKIYQIEPSATAIAADGMRCKSDYNHKVGINFLRADLGVEWFTDPGGLLGQGLPDDEDDASSSSTNKTWKTLDDHNDGTIDPD